MADVRCKCGKILCQTESPAVPKELVWKEAKKIIIKCRHCKRYFILHVSQIERVQFADDPAAALSVEGEA